MTECCDGVCGCGCVGVWVCGCVGELEGEEEVMWRFEILLVEIGQCLELSGTRPWMDGWMDRE